MTARAARTDRWELWLAMGWLAAASLVVVAVAVPVWLHQNLNDDSFITLTYAKNLAAGNGFVFNHGPPTLGTTTPLFTLLVALLAALLPFPSVAEAAITLSVGAWIGTGWMLYLLLRRLELPPLQAALAASFPLLLVDAWVGLLGMEIWPFQLLLVTSLHLALSGRAFAAGACVSALFLTRGEGALVGFLLFGWLWHARGRRDVVLLCAGGTLALLPWIAYALGEFGTLLPNTLSAKQAQGALPAGGYFIVRMLASLLPGHLHAFSPGGLWWLNGYALLIAAGLAFAWREKRALLLVPAWGALYLLGYTIVNPKPYGWYALNAIFVAEVLAGVGLAWLAARSFSARQARTRLATGALAAALGTAALGPALAVHLPEALASGGDRRAAVYRDLADWLAAHSEPEESVAYMEIGYLGYFTANRIVDLAGLVDPVVTAHMREGGYAWGFWHYRPDYYVDVREFDWALAEITPALADYDLVHEVPRESGSTPLRLYARKATPAVAAPPPRP